MKIYNEEEQCDKGNKQNIQFEEKMDTRSRIELNPVFKEIKQIKKWNKESGDLRAKSDPAKLPTCERD